MFGGVCTLLRFFMGVGLAGIVGVRMFKLIAKSINAFFDKIEDKL